MDDEAATPSVRAGGLLWRDSEQGPEVALVLDPNRTWTLPVGDVRPDEKPAAAALRVVSEQTGYKAEIVAWAGEPGDEATSQVLIWHMTITRRLRRGRDDANSLNWVRYTETNAHLADPREARFVVASHPPLASGSAEPSYRRLVRGESSRAASDRLTAAVENFEAEFRYRTARGNLGDDAWKEAVESGIRDVRRHHSRGHVEIAWRRFAGVARLELEVMNDEELAARADALRHEAASKKLASAWRSESIVELLPADVAGHSSGPDFKRRVSEATRIRDEDADNRYYRVALIRGQRTLLLLVLIVSITLLVLVTPLVAWKDDVNDPSWGFVVLVILFGGIGACLSAIQSLGRTGHAGRIPEHVASSVVTLTRPALGAAAALGVYVIVASGILSLTLSDETAHLTVLALAFAAGFSERLVLSAVGAATGATQAS